MQPKVMQPHGDAPAQKVTFEERSVEVGDKTELPVWFSPGVRQIPSRGQRVEKVVVGPVGGPKEARNKAKTLR